MNDKLTNKEIMEVFNWGSEKKVQRCLKELKEFDLFYITQSDYGRWINTLNKEWMNKTLEIIEATI